MVLRSAFDSSLIATEVGGMRTVVCANGKWLHKTGLPRHPRDLIGQPCVGFPTLRGRPWRFREEGADFAVPVTGRLEFNQAEAAVEACVAGQGYGRFFLYQVQQALSEKRLRLVLEPFEVPPVAVCMLWGGAPIISPRLRAMIDWLKPRLTRSCRQ